MKTGKTYTDSKERSPAASPAAGFTLVELSIVLIVSSLVMVSTVVLYEQYVRKQRMQTTKEHLAEAGAQISFFFSTMSRYPCPANRALTPADPMYGHEFDADPTAVDITTYTAGCDPSAIGLAMDSCLPGGGLCLVSGTRDTEADADILPDPVLIGALPVASLRKINGSLVPNKIGVDGWGSQITYAVTLSQTGSGPYEYEYYNGVIRVEDEFGNNTAGNNDDGHYVLASHGPDKKGGFEITGIRYSPCGPGPALDIENCDDDYTFTQALAYSRANSPQYYDDHVYVAKNRSTELWAYIASPSGPTNHIFNLNARFVGVKTDTPAQQLDVAGTIKAPNNTKTTFLCDENGNNCFDVRKISGNLAGADAIRCDSGKVLTGISLGEEICTTPTFAPIQPNVDCSPGWVHGIKTNGDVICTP